MDFNKLTQKLQEAVAEAQSLAASGGHQEIDNLHLLKALLQQHEGLLSRLLQKMNVPAEELLQGTEALLQRKPSVSGSGAGTMRRYASPALIAMLEQAEQEAAKMQDEFVAVEHAVLAMASDSSSGNRELRGLFTSRGVTREKLLGVLAEIRGHQRVTSREPEATYEVLEKYGRDLVAEVRAGRSIRSSDVMPRFAG